MMKYPEYDSPFKFIVDDIALEIAKKVDDDCWKAVQKASIEVDKEKLLEALKQDSSRYREAFQKGYETGYEHRDDEIVRCKDCYNMECDGRAGTIVCGITGESHSRLWFCANGEREEKE